MFLLCKHVRLTCGFNKLMMMMMMNTAGQKLEWWGYRAEKEVWRYLQLSGYNAPTWQTDRQTDTEQRPRLSIASRGKKANIWFLANSEIKSQELTTGRPRSKDLSSLDQIYRYIWWTFTSANIWINLLIGFIQPTIWSIYRLFVSLFFIFSHLW